MSRALVIGAGGGIGGALVQTLVEGGRHREVIAGARHPAALALPGAAREAIDVADPASIAAAAARIGAPLDLVIVATGLLHDAAGGPERSLRELDAERLARSFAVNAIGPALVLRHFAPLLAREGRSLVACLSARVGSIADNRLGGWYGYRASKAALNQIVRTAAIEIARGRPDAICVALHPGTVDTGLSRPFQRGVPAGQLFSPPRAAAQLIGVIAGLTPAHSGRIFAWDGSEIAP